MQLRERGKKRWFLPFFDGPYSLLTMFCQYLFYNEINCFFPILSLTHDSLSKHHRTNLNWFCISFLVSVSTLESIRSRHRAAHLRTTCSSWQSQQIPLGKHGNLHLIFYRNQLKWKPELMSIFLEKALWWYYQGHACINPIFPHLLSLLKSVLLKNNFLYYWVKPIGSERRHAAPNQPAAV